MSNSTDINELPTLSTPEPDSSGSSGLFSTNLPFGMYRIFLIFFFFVLFSGFLNYMKFIRWRARQGGRYFTTRPSSRNREISRIRSSSSQSRMGNAITRQEDDRNRELPPIPPIEQISNLDDRLKNEPCVICLEILENEGVASPPCGHVMHEGCLRKWLLLDRQRACPICRIGSNQTNTIEP